VLSGGRAVRFTDMQESLESASIVVADFTTGQQRVLVPGGACARLAVPASLLVGNTREERRHACAGLLRLELSQAS
jgi:hypothetical protein